MGDKKCGTCKHYIGGGDFNLCCMLHYDLCYKHTPACNDYTEKEDGLIDGTVRTAEPN